MDKEDVEDIQVHNISFNPAVILIFYPLAQQYFLFPTTEGKIDSSLRDFFLRWWWFEWLAYSLDQTSSAK